MPFNSLAFALLLGSNRFLIGFRQVPMYWVLLAGSVVFYLTAGIVDFSVIASAIGVNWVLQRLSKNPKLYLTVAVTVNLSLLAYFKYKGIFDTGSFVGGSYTDLVLPLGISFYTFQMIAYHFDVARKHSPAAPSFKHFVLFVSFYPQLVAGPIVRANQLLPQIARVVEGRLRPNRLVVFGLALILLGLVKKVIFADSLGPIVDDIFFIGPDSLGQAWLGAILFSFQIYFDFSGYSDIAVGAAYLLGFRIPFNFRTPYLSTGPGEFWQRWHITLSSWIRDYLYIPLGGSQGNRFRVALVLVFTMSLAGLWHGANNTFIVWGAAWGVYILMGRVMQTISIKTTLVRWFFHMAIVTILWVLFRAPDIGSALDYIAVMFDVGSGLGEVVTAMWIAVGIIGLYMSSWLESSVGSWLGAWNLRRISTRFIGTVLIGLILGLLLIPTDSQNPFIYFRF
jgi:alginate O-acetyltransferase complex protein AlgI